jgi:hypothetical protein
VEAEAAVPVAEERPHREPAEARRERPARREREPRAEREPRVEREPRTEPARAQGRPQRAEPEPRRGRERDDEDRGVVGFGADTPAFLMRAPVRLPPAGTED